MGFGRGKGFTSKVRTEMTKYTTLVGGRGIVTLTELRPAYTAKCGVQAVEAETELNPTYTMEVIAENVEEQTDHSSFQYMWEGGNSRLAQRLTITDRTVTKLGFWLAKEASPDGTVTFTIRRVDPDEIIVSKLWGNAADLTTETIYYELEFDASQYVNEEVRICVEVTGGSYSDLVRAYNSASDVKADELLNYYSSGSWKALSKRDMAYRYKYS